MISNEDGFCQWRELWVRSAGHVSLDPVLVRRDRPYGHRGGHLIPSQYTFSSSFPQRRVKAQNVLGLFEHHQKSLHWNPLGQHCTPVVGLGKKVLLFAVVEAAHALVHPISLISASMESTHPKVAKPYRLDRSPANTHYELH